MAKTYGGRWRTVADLGRGGQADVFEVTDLTYPEGGRFALKRVRNPARRNRFEAEVVAIKSLDHPNIIKLVDHTALDAAATSDDKQFLVMPLAGGGDLAARARGYEQSLDGVLAVARPLASALTAAHASGIVHRDVKPANVLFADAGNNPWLSDFGICLIRKAERNTETEEVAGPWAFMAPELEGGGRLEVTPAADVYSLGKLIYYMLSGGVIVPRERLADPEYTAVFHGGERYRSLEFLLRRMVCTLNQRLSAMAEVEAELARIADWDRNAIVPPFSRAKLDRIQALQRSVLEERDAAAQHEAARQARDQKTSTVAAETTRSAEVELAKAAALLSEGGIMRASIRTVPKEDLTHTEVNDLYALTGVELAIPGLSVNYPAQHILQVLVCRPTKLTVTMHVGSGPAPQPVLEEVVLRVLPRVKRLPLPDGRNQHMPDTAYCFTESKHLWLPPSRAAKQAQAQRRQNRFEHQEQPIQIRCLELPTDKWPIFETVLQGFLQTVCDDFLEVLERSRNSMVLEGAIWR